MLWFYSPCLPLWQAGNGLPLVGVIILQRHSRFKIVINKLVLKTVAIFELESSGVAGIES